MDQKEREHNEKLVMGIFLQVADAIRYLHEKNLTHNDISLSNVLRKGSQWKLSDFSLAKEVDDVDTQSSVTTLGTTRPFAPPEKVLYRKFSPASDMYSLGVVMFTSITGSLKLFDEIGANFAKKQTVDPSLMVKDYFANNQLVVCTCSEEVKEMIVKLVELDYKQRPTAAHVCEVLERFLKKNVRKQKK